MTIPIPPYNPPYAPIPNVTPFTNRDALTYLEVLEGLRKGLNDVITYVNENFSELGDTFAEEVNKLITEVNLAVTAALQQNQEDVTAQLAAQDAAITAQIAEIQTIAFNDPVITALITDVETTTRQLLDSLYGGGGITGVLTEEWGSWIVLTPDESLGFSGIELAGTTTGIGSVKVADTGVDVFHNSMGLRIINGAVRVEAFGLVYPYHETEATLPTEPVNGMTVILAGRGLIYWNASANDWAGEWQGGSVDDGDIADLIEDTDSATHEALDDYYDLKAAPVLDAEFTTAAHPFWDDVFTKDVGYRIVVEATTSDSAYIAMRLRKAGVEDADAHYSVTPPNAGDSVNQFALTENDVSDPGFWRAEVILYGLGSPTAAYQNGPVSMRNYNAYHSTVGPWDGFSLFGGDGPSSQLGTITGRVRVYEIGGVGPQGEEGPQGPQGEPGEDGADGAPGADGADGTDGTSFVWRGLWSNVVNYAIDDVVNYGGATWIATAPNINKPSPDNLDVWDLFTDKGSTGDTGPQGPQGDPGVVSDSGMQSVILNESSLTRGALDSLYGGGGSGALGYRQVVRDITAEEFPGGGMITSGWSTSATGAGSSGSVASFAGGSFTIQETGFYIVSLHLSFSATTVDGVTVEGPTGTALGTNILVEGGLNYVSLSGLIRLEVGDEVGAGVWTSEETYQWNVGSPNESRFSVVRIA